MSGPLTGGRPSHASADVAAVLVVRSPVGISGRSVAVGRAGVVVGRDATSDLVLDSPYVSRRHAWVGAAEGEVVVTDMDSANGTRVAGVRVVGPTRLRVGDTLVLGDVEVELVDPVRAGDATPIPTPRARGSDRPTAGPTVPMPVPVPHPGRSGGQSPRSRPGATESRVGRPGPALALAVLGSVVGTVLTKELGTSQWGTLIAAATLSVVSGEEPSMTFPVPGPVAGPGPDERVTSEEVATGELVVEYCDAASSTCAATLASTGDLWLDVTSVYVTDASFTPSDDLEGPSEGTASWTITTDECTGSLLDPADACRIEVAVDVGASGPGTYSGALVVEHSGDRGSSKVPLSLDTTSP
jgi:FHA domain